MRVLWIAMATVVACSSPAAEIEKPEVVSSEPAARDFATHLLDVLERDDLDGWQTLLSARMQSRLTDDDQLRSELDSWRRELLPRAHALREADYALDTTGEEHFVFYALPGKHAEALAMVVVERGALRLDGT